jgi:acyl carrier protein
MSNLSDIQQRVFTIINEVADENDKVVVDEFNDELDLRENFNLDSLDLAELTVRLEEEFEVDIFEDGLVSTVKEIVNKIM